MTRLACVAGALGGGFGTGKAKNLEREKLEEASARARKSEREESGRGDPTLSQTLT